MFTYVPPAHGRWGMEGRSPPLLVLSRRALPRDEAEKRAWAPYVVALAETAMEGSRHATLAEAIRDGPGATVWRARDREASWDAGVGPLAEIRADPAV